MKQLFRKSNIIHIRTNEGEFEVSNPEILHEKTRWLAEKDTTEWGGDVELIKQRGAINLTLARLLPKEEKKAESAYKTVSSNTQSCGKFEIKSHYDFEPVESSEPQEKSIESEKYELRRILQMQVNCLREDEMDNSDAVAIRGTTAQRIMKFLDPVSAPSESQPDIFYGYLEEGVYGEFRHVPEPSPNKNKIGFIFGSKRYEFSRLAEPDKNKPECQEEMRKKHVQQEELWDEAISIGESEKSRKSAIHKIMKSFTITRNP